MSALKVALVTGGFSRFWMRIFRLSRSAVVDNLFLCASSGIGASAAEFLAAEGYALSLSGRNEDALVRTQTVCIEAGLSPDKVNAAGILVNGSVLDTPMDEYDKQMLINVRSVISLTRLTLPHIIKSKGTIVNVSSVAGTNSFPGVTYYCVSKAAIDQFTKCLALEMAPHGVRVNAVNPGVIITDIHRRSGQDEETYRKFLEKCRETHALGRPGTVDEVSRAIVFLAGPASSFTTGHLLLVDGGRHVMTPR